MIFGAAHTSNKERLRPGLPREVDQGGGFEGDERSGSMGQGCAIEERGSRLNFAAL